jgi:hypothetical protein
VRTVDLGEAQPLTTSQGQPGQVPPLAPADPAGIDSPVESPLDTAVRISRRTPIAVPGFGTPPPQNSAGRSLDDYFDQLDAAFASLQQAPPTPAVYDIEPEGELPTGPDTPPAQDDSGPAPAAAPPAAAPVLAQAFSALFAAEHGDASAPAFPAFYAAPQASTDELVERVTEQVLQQLTDRVVRETVTDIVSRVAERLVRDEIDRVRSTIK